MTPSGASPIRVQPALRLPAIRCGPLGAPSLSGQPWLRLQERDFEGRSLTDGKSVFGPGRLTFSAQLHPAEVAWRIRSVGVPERIPGAPVLVGRDEYVREAREQKAFAVSQDPLVSLLLCPEVPFAVHPVPQLGILPGLVGVPFRVRQSDLEVVFDEPVPIHHHVDRPTHGTDEVECLLASRLIRSLQLQLPEDVSVGVEELGPRRGSDIGKSAANLGFGAVRSSSSSAGKKYFSAMASSFCVGWAGTRPPVRATLAPSDPA